MSTINTRSGQRHIGIGRLAQGVGVAAVLLMLGSLVSACWTFTCDDTYSCSTSAPGGDAGPT